MVSNLKINLEDWMGELPKIIRRKVSIIYLAIPGTHNSMTYKINSSSKIAPDANKTVQRVNVLCPLIVRRYSKNQRIDILKQLKLGVR